MTDLLSCPFCGGEAIYGKSEASGRVRTVCVDCLASTDFLAGTDEAAAAWNSRAERTARLEYNEIHGCNVCTGCGERYEHDKYIALTDDYLIAFKPMRFCPNCGVRFKEDDDGNE